MISPLHIPDAWMWSVWQPERGMPFNSYLFKEGDALAAVDPLPLDDAALEWVGLRGGIRTIVLTNRDHARWADALRARFGAQILASDVEAPLFEIAVDRTFSDGDEVFSGARAIRMPHGKTPGEVALHIAAGRAAVIGDALIGSPAGALSLLPDAKLEDRRQLLNSLRRLWSLNLDALLLGDGQPILRNADGVLGEFLEVYGGAEINRINRDELRSAPREYGKFEAEDFEIGLLIGARKLGYRIAELPPGKAFCPLHSHVLEEEFFFVLDGHPSIRTLRGTIACRPGDFIAFPTGRRGTHQLRNDSAAPCTVLLVGMNGPEEVCFYPDSEKVLVDTAAGRLIVRAKPALDYLDGE